MGFLFSFAPLMQIFFPFFAFIFTLLNSVRLKFSPMAHHEITVTCFAPPPRMGPSLFDMCLMRPTLKNVLKNVSSEQELKSEKLIEQDFCSDELMDRRAHFPLPLLPGQRVKSFRKSKMIFFFKKQNKKTRLFLHFFILHHPCVTRPRIVIFT